MSAGSKILDGTYIFKKQDVFVTDYNFGRLPIPGLSPRRRFLKSAAGLESVSTMLRLINDHFLDRVVT